MLDQLSHSKIPRSAVFRPAWVRLYAISEMMTLAAISGHVGVASLPGLFGLYQVAGDEALQ